MIQALLDVMLHVWASASCVFEWSWYPHFEEFKQSKKLKTLEDVGIMIFRNVHSPNYTAWDPPVWDPESCNMLMYFSSQYIDDETDATRTAWQEDGE